jgi:hypothetical protein
MVRLIMQNIYFQAFRNGEYVASGFCESIETAAAGSSCQEVKFWTGNNFIAIGAVNLEVLIEQIHV